ncbi:FTH2 [Candida oxycetoniae]|uniref:Phosphatidylglycerol/phosphatidylinositol transfer protein n=1 Tax=Candida oxycetoniae TaxID=497107 RepID=A0AAI9WXG0_9ASCO|nr:FTH2 [Candida oxycetoniae]KAI3404033.2 FTH2 [Candida oxycetoniae]
MVSLTKLATFAIAASAQVECLSLLDRYIDRALLVFTHKSEPGLSQFFKPNYPLIQSIAHSDQDTKPVFGDSPIEICDIKEAQLLTLDEVIITPNPPEAGANLTFTATGTIDKTITDGAYVEVDVRYGFIKLIHQTYDLCKEITKVDLKCPVNQGKQVISKTIEIPQEVPPGRYFVTARAYTKDDEYITCLTATVVFPAIFFIILRETLETAIIISVLLSFINQRSHKPNDAVPPTQQQQHGTSSQQVESALSSKAVRLTQVQRKLKLQVWVGAFSGLVICFIIGLIFILSFYFIGKDYWSYTERVWEGVFSILSSAIITVMGIGLLRINKVMKLKWWIKLGDAYNGNDLDEEGEEEIAKWGDDNGDSNVTSVADERVVSTEDAGAVANYGGTRSSSESETIPLTLGAAAAADNTITTPTPTTTTTTTTNKSLPSSGTMKPRKKQGFSRKYFLAILPLVTTLREGLESVVFIGGIGLSQPLTSIPLSIICGITFGSSIGYLLYKGGNKLSLQYFLICSTCFLYIVSAGLMSRGVWFLELESYVRKCNGLDVSETGSGPGSYDIVKSVWHVNCCNGLTDGWWMVLNAIFGWTNSATYGSVITYCSYWLAVIIWLKVKLYEERHGLLPWIPVRWQIKRIRKKIRLFELKNSQSLQVLENGNQNRAEDIEAEAEAQGLLEGI